MPKNISAATLMVLSACIIWGAQPMFVTFVVREFDPIPLVSIRYFTVGVVPVSYTHLTLPTTPYV